MNRKQLVVTLAATLVVVLVAAFFWQSGQTGTAAQAPDGAVSITAAEVSSRISYQGILKEGGNPVTGSRNMTFRLYNDSTCTAQVSSIPMSNVPVTAGLFSVKLDVNQVLFDGQGLWLGVDVGSTGSNTTCEEITPVPYALSLRPGAAIVGNIASSPVISVTNTYSPTVGMASDGENGSNALQGFSTRGSGVRGDSASGAGVHGDSVSGAGVRATASLTPVSAATAWMALVSKAPAGETMGDISSPQLQTKLGFTLKGRI